jgi:hypothetical protein
MDFNFPSSEIFIPTKLELWMPLEEGPGLNEREMNSILGENGVIESLHIAIPSFLVSSENEEFGYSPCFELNRHYLVGKLKQSSYMIFYEEKNTSKQMTKHLKEKFLEDQSNYYMFDAFFDPFFGGISPKYCLFQRVTFETIPDSMILFKDDKSDMGLNQLFLG